MNKEFTEDELEFYLEAASEGIMIEIIDSFGGVVESQTQYEVSYNADDGYDVVYHNFDNGTSDSINAYSDAKIHDLDEFIKWLHELRSMCIFTPAEGVREPEADLILQYLLDQAEQFRV